jgi:hypothetical protein
MTPHQIKECRLGLTATSRILIFSITLIALQAYALSTEGWNWNDYMRNGAEANQQFGFWGALFGGLSIPLVLTLSAEVLKREFMRFRARTGDGQNDL